MLLALEAKLRVKSKETFHLFIYKLLLFEFFTRRHEFKYCLTNYFVSMKIHPPVSFKVVMEVGGRRKVLFIIHTSLKEKSNFNVV